MVRVWGISDLHLSFSTNKPMDVFGHHWRGHADQMAKAWDALVSPEDIVLCPGDLSWAMRLEEAKADLEWIGARPGQKILGRGNHDYWWSSISKVRASLPSGCVALQNDCVDLGFTVVAGSRCWAAPGGLDYSAQDQKIYERECIRLHLSLEAAQKIAKGRPLIAAIHYPPFAANHGPTGFSELLEKYAVRLCVYGHLHGERSHRTAVQGEVRGVEYRLLACDFLKFSPALLVADTDALGLNLA
ncbi:MAG: metallophosphoesterase [Myxococcaceae bacterium]|nr:metallophosphoesterase [Myxococcaceae bacterium]MBH2006025.1 metallophosphoesterase [Myxococcaceae bacterium]